MDMDIILTTVSFFTGCVVLSSSIHIQRHTSFLTAEPVPRLAHCGGLQTVPEESISSTCSVFNPATQAWDENEIGKMTQPRWMHAAVTLTNVGTYIFGGYSEPTPGTMNFYQEEVDSGWLDQQSLS